MTQEEIKDKIDFNNQLIESLLKPDFFVLNQQVFSLLKENEALRLECKHEFENGVCKFCGKSEK